MNLIVETTFCLGLSNFLKIDRSEAIELKGKMTRSVKKYDVRIFEMRINNVSPKIFYNIEYDNYAQPIVSHWDIEGNPNDFISRIWLGGVEVFNFEDYEYYARFTDNEEKRYEVMYLKDR